MRIGDLRNELSETCHRRSYFRTFAGLARDLLLYGVPVAGALLLDSVALRLASGLVAGVFVAVLFIWGHDAAHGALFRSQRVAEVLGSLAMAPSLQPYRLWQHGHNRVHHGFTSLLAIDWIWRPWSPSQLRAASPAARLGYRVERSLVGCGWHYLRRVWWDGMVRFRPTTASGRRDLLISRLGTGAWIVVSVTVAWRLGGPWSVIAAVVVPWLIFNWVIAFLTYLHHTHPSRRFAATRADWDPVTGHVQGSTVLDLPRPLSWLLHDITVHTPHHLDTRIPYYRLRQAWTELRPLVAGLDVLEYRPTIGGIRRTFAACQLYEPSTATWSTMAAA